MKGIVYKANKPMDKDVFFEPVIYGIYNTREQKYYIGRTFQPFTKRWLIHCKGTMDTGKKFSSVFQNTPITEWAFMVLEKIKVPSKLKMRWEIENYLILREAHWIGLKNSIENGYNTDLPKKRFNPGGLEAGWILTRHETDEFYGQVQWADEYGNLTDRSEVVQRSFDGEGYSFTKSGLGELIIIGTKLQ